MQGQQEHRLWAWNISALVYEWAYIQVAHQTDVDLFAYLGERVSGATIADCGCGPGVVSEKFLRAGAAKVVTLDSNPGMIEKTRQRLCSYIASGCAFVIQRSHEGDGVVRAAHEVLNGEKFDLVLFKRSLYMSRPQALATLRHVAGALRPSGMIVVIHPERHLLRYAFAPPIGMTRYTPFHLFNRVISRVAEFFGAEEYTLYSHRELLALLQDVVPRANVVSIPSQQRPYNLAVLHMP
jgi:SAM-dependent methyltransferase